MILLFYSLKQKIKFDNFLLYAKLEMSYLRFSFFVIYLQFFFYLLISIVSLKKVKLSHKTTHTTYHLPPPPLIHSFIHPSIHPHYNIHPFNYHLHTILRPSIYIPALCIHSTIDAIVVLLLLLFF